MAPVTEPKRVEEKLFSCPLSIQAGRNNKWKDCEVGPCWGMLSEEVCELLQMSHQFCIRNLSIAVHIDESFVKTNSKCLPYWIYSVLEKNVCFSHKEFMEDILYSKHLKELLEYIIIHLCLCI